MSDLHPRPLPARYKSNHARQCNDGPQTVIFNHCTYADALAFISHAYICQNAIPNVIGAANATAHTYIRTLAEHSNQLRYRKGTRGSNNYMQFPLHSFLLTILSPEQTFSQISIILYGENKQNCKWSDHDSNSGPFHSTQFRDTFPAPANFLYTNRICSPVHTTYISPNNLGR